MTTDAPEWRVMAVFDPDGGGQDFAYTIGLAAKGHPELHVWARPTDGLDPGVDFKLSAEDCGHLLNRFSEELLSGDLVPGSTVHEDFDAGLTRAVFTLGEPVPPHQVEARLVSEGAAVIPIRWTLERPPAGAPRDCPDETWAKVVDLSDRIRADPPSTTDAIEMLGSLLRPEIGAELGTQREMARVSGDLAGIRRCHARANVDARALVAKSPELFRGLRGSQLVSHKDWVRQAVEHTLLAAYSWLVVGDMPNEGKRFASYRLVEAVIDRRSSWTRFWAMPQTLPVMSRAFALEPGEVEQLAKEVDRLGAGFHSELWWAVGQCAAAGSGVPALSDVDLVFLFSSQLRVVPADQLLLAGAGVAGAAAFEALRLVRGDWVTELADPWRSVIN